MSGQPNPISCGGGCKAQVADDLAAQNAGWSYYETIRRYRCGACDRELLAASSMPGTPDNPPDLLAPADRGGLPMPKGFGVVPVAVKG